MPKSKPKSRKSAKPAKKSSGMSSMIPNFKLQPMQDRVLIKEDSSSEERKTSSGIIIPVTASEDKGSKQGKVVAVGPGRMEDGRLITPTVKPGNIVLFQWGDKIKVDEEEYYVVRESEILAIIR